MLACSHLHRLHALTNNHTMHCDVPLCHCYYHLHLQQTSLPPLPYYPTAHVPSLIPNLFPPTQPRPRIIPTLLLTLSLLRIPARPTRIPALREMAIITLLLWRRPWRRRGRHITLREIRLLAAPLLLWRLAPGLMLLLLSGWGREELLMCGGRDRVVLVVLGGVVL
jgi:hypothetical protein